MEKALIVSRWVPQPSAAISERRPVYATEGRPSSDNPDDFSSSNCFSNETVNASSVEGHEEFPGKTSEIDSDDIFKEGAVSEISTADAQETQKRKEEQYMRRRGPLQKRSGFHGGETRRNCDTGYSVEGEGNHRRNR